MNVDPEQIAKTGLSIAELQDIAFIAAYQRSIAPNFELRYDWGRLGEMSVRLAGRLERYYTIHPELRPGGILEEKHDSTANDQPAADASDTIDPEWTAAP